jgi:hypothetical protein
MKQEKETEPTKIAAKRFLQCFDLENMTGRCGYCNCFCHEKAVPTLKLYNINDLSGVLEKYTLKTIQNGFLDRRLPFKLFSHRYQEEDEKLYQNEIDERAKFSSIADEGQYENDVPFAKSVSYEKISSEQVPKIIYINKQVDEKIEYVEESYYKPEKRIATTDQYSGTWKIGSILTKQYTGKQFYAGTHLVPKKVPIYEDVPTEINETLYLCSVYTTYYYIKIIHSPCTKCSCEVCSVSHSKNNGINIPIYDQWITHFNNVINNKDVNNLKSLCLVCGEFHHGGRSAQKKCTFKPQVVKEKYADTDLRLCFHYAYSPNLYYKQIESLTPITHSCSCFHCLMGSNYSSIRCLLPTCCYYFLLPTDNAVTTLRTNLSYSFNHKFIGYNDYLNILKLISKK